MENKIITSRENETFKDLLKLTDKKWRRRMGLCIIEGEKVVRDNLHRAEQIFIREKLPSKLEGWRAGRDGVSVLSDKLWGEISSLENDTGILATVKIPASREVTSPFLVLDGIQDAGNMGTLLRTAAAFGFGTVFCIDCVDVWSPKVLRASSGTQFGLNIVETSEFMKPKDSFLVGADLNGEGPFAVAASLRSSQRPFGIVLGNEGRGLSERVKTQVDRFVTIPMQPGVESLNVAVAGGILMYELTLAHKQLSQTPL